MSGSVYQSGSDFGAAYVPPPSGTSISTADDTHSHSFSGTTVSDSHNHTLNGSVTSYSGSSGPSGTSTTVANRNIHPVLGINFIIKL